MRNYNVINTICTVAANDGVDSVRSAGMDDAHFVYTCHGAKAKKVKKMIFFEIFKNNTYFCKIKPR